MRVGQGFERAEGRLAHIPELVQVHFVRWPVVIIERYIGVGQLAQRAEAGAEITRGIHLVDQRTRDGFAIRIHGEPGQRVIVPDPVFQHLRGGFDEVPFEVAHGQAGKVRLGGEHAVDEVAEFVEEGLDLLVFHQAGRVVARREIAQ